MRDWIDLGATPPGESCAQLGTPDYHDRARRECRAYIARLRRAMGPEPPGARLALKANPHDFGTYLSVVCHYETGDEQATDYAFRCEAEGPEAWDDQARAELGLSLPSTGSDDPRSETNANRMD